MATDGTPRPEVVFAGERQLDRGSFGDAHGRRVGESSIADLLRAGRHLAESGLVETPAYRQPTLCGGDALVGVGVQR